MAATTTSVPNEAQIALGMERALRSLLPGAWAMSIDSGPASRAPHRGEIVLEMTPPHGTTAVFSGPVVREATSLDLTRGQRRGWRGAVPGARPLFVASWLSPGFRDRLAAQGVSYADATGNLRITSDDPALLITGTGAPRNPWPGERELQSLRGRGAAVAVRALLQAVPPFGVREVAGRTGASAATLSRVLGLLEREGLVQRSGRGAVEALDMAGTVRRWALDYDVLRSNDALPRLQPRGLADLSSRLERAGIHYALTGSAAAGLVAPAAPARLAMLYVSDERGAEEALDLRETEAGANVILLRPFDDVVFSGTIERNGLRLVNPAQLAVDLLTSPGRGPAEGEEILNWMAANTDAWRT